MDDDISRRPATATTRTTNPDSAQVRRALHEIRKEWREHSESRPLNPSAPVFGDISAEQFAFGYVVGNHLVRPSRDSDVAGKQIEAAYEAE